MLTLSPTLYLHRPELELFYPNFVPEETYYARIGVPEDASRSLIKKSYYRLAKNFHPDRNPDADPHKFAELSKARLFRRSVLPE